MSIRRVRKKSRSGSVDEVLYWARYAAQRCGYAIGLHGSLKRDIDIMAMPWSSSAVPAQTLAEAIAQELGYEMFYKVGPRRPGGRRSVLLKHPDARRLDAPDAKGHWDPMVVDLSIMEPQPTAKEEFMEWYAREKANGLQDLKVFAGTVEVRAHSEDEIYEELTAINRAVAAGKTRPLTDI